MPNIKIDYFEADDYSVVLVYSCYDKMFKQRGSSSIFLEIY